MADTKAGKADGNDNVGQSGTDNFPTYQDEAGLTAADKGKVGGKEADSADAGRDDSGGGVKLNHGQESPQAAAERKALEEDPFTPTPVQMLPENQDETVAPKK